MQEAHAKSYLDGPSSGLGISQAGRYPVYKLPAESALIRVEFTSVIIIDWQLLTLKLVQPACLSAWLQRGRSCPVHARDT